MTICEHLEFVTFLQDMGAITHQKGSTRYASSIANQINWVLAILDVKDSHVMHLSGE